MTEKSLKEVLAEIIPKMVPALLDILEAPKTSATNKIKAMDMLLRIANGRSWRSPAHIEAARAAVTALERAKPLLEAISKSHKSLKMRERAARALRAMGAK